MPSRRAGGSTRTDGVIAVALSLLAIGVPLGLSLLGLLLCGLCLRRFLLHLFPVRGLVLVLLFPEHLLGLLPQLFDLLPQFLDFGPQAVNEFGQFIDAPVRVAAVVRTSPPCM